MLPFFVVRFERVKAPRQWPGALIRLDVWNLSPTHAFLVLDRTFVKNWGDEMDEIRIFNTLGQLVKSEKINSNQINISELLKGTYFIQFLDKKRNPIAMKKFFKL